jgi:hypothetical protein
LDSHELFTAGNYQYALNQVVLGILFAFTLVPARDCGQLPNICIAKHIRQIHHLSPRRFTTIMGKPARFILFPQKK